MPGYDDAHLGATGRFPEGQPINEHDQGELRAAVMVDRKKNVLVLDFSTSVSFLILTREQAEGLAVVLERKAVELKRRR